MIEKISQAQILDLEEQACSNPRRRKALVLSQPNDSLQLLINSIAIGSYSRKHRFVQLQRIEVLRGQLAAMIWLKLPNQTPDAIIILEPGDAIEFGGGDNTPFHALVAFAGTATIEESLIGLPYRPENREDVTTCPLEVGMVGGDTAEETERRAATLANWLELILHNAE